MQNVSLSNPKKLFDALRQGQKVAVFAIDEEEKPICMLSGLNSAFFENIDGENSLIAPAVKHIHDNYNKEIRLADLSRLCDISPGYFCKLFFAQYNTSFSQYLIGLRLAKAKMLLATTDKRVVNISVEVGYYDSGYFTKLFSKREGCTPLQYRNRTR